jgi:hypothetical protein
VRFLNMLEVAEYKKKVKMAARQARRGGATSGSMSREFVSQNALRGSYLSNDQVLQCGIADRYVGGLTRCSVFPETSPPAMVQRAMALATRPHSTHMMEVGGEVQWIPDFGMRVLHKRSTRQQGNPDDDRYLEEVEEYMSLPLTTEDPVYLSKSLFDNDDIIERTITDADVEILEHTPEDFENERRIKVAKALGITMEI